MYILKERICSPKKFLQVQPCENGGNCITARCISLGPISMYFNGQTDHISQFSVNRMTGIQVANSVQSSFPIVP